MRIAAFCVWAALSVVLFPVTVHAQIERIWLGHRTPEPTKLVISWTSARPGDSRVRFGPTPALGSEIHQEGNTTLHHVEIPLPEAGPVHYAVLTNDQASKPAVFKGYPKEQLRVAVVGDWHGGHDIAGLIRDDVHLLLSAGDNIPSLHRDCGAGVVDCITPYAKLIDTQPELFRSVPFLPVLGNHDREIRPRGSKPPAEPVYDVDATAFRKFFELPDEEWRWRFSLPAFAATFVALDLNHIQDQGTTWQTCHPLTADSEQFNGYRALMNARPKGFVFTLQNERNASIRGAAKGVWKPLMGRSTAVITGFGHFAERAEADGATWFNTSLLGRGAKYPDPASKFLANEDNYLLLTFRKGEPTVRAELKAVTTGAVLDAVDLKREG